MGHSRRIPTQALEGKGIGRGGGIVAVSLLMNILNLESGKMVGREQQSQLWVEKSEQGH